METPGQGHPCLLYTSPLILRRRRRRRRWMAAKVQSRPLTPPLHRHNFKSNTDQSTHRPPDTRHQHGRRTTWATTFLTWPTNPPLPFPRSSTYHVTSPPTSRDNPHLPHHRHVIHPTIPHHYIWISRHLKSTPHHTTPTHHQDIWNSRQKGGEWRHFGVRTPIIPLLQFKLVI